jgi:hypothetical protein
MNAKLLAPIAAIALLAGNAYAESPTVVKDDFTSTKSRAEVTAELSAYKKAGVNPWSISYNPLRTFQSTASRSQVTAAYIAARDEVAAVNGEDSGSAYFAQGGARGTDATRLAGKPANAQ